MAKYRLMVVLWHEKVMSSL